MKKSVKNISGFISAAIIGILGGLMGLGGAEFRLPVLVGLFRFATLQGIITNLVLSLVTVTFSFIFRSATIPLGDITANSHIVLNLLAGSIIGAFAGVRLATKINAKKLDSIVFIFLFLLGVFMILHSSIHLNPIQLPVMIKIILGFFCGIIIGIVSSMLGVAGGELIIPAIILLFATGIKLAGSLSLCVSFPTILIGLYKYRQHHEFSIVKNNMSFVSSMAAGSVLGAFIGSRLLTGLSAGTLQTILGIILLISAIKVFTFNNKRSRS
jgi:uncharacterized membrane protein YfcA